MAVIGFDTSTANTSVALLVDGSIRVSDEVANRPGETLAPAVASLLSGISMDSLTAIGVGLGPGPFTGLRVGIVFAAAMGHALGIPVYGMCSLDAFGLADGVAVSDARRREVYWARYSGGARVEGPHVVKPAELVLGDDAVVGTRLYPELLGAGGPEYPSAIAIAEFAAEQLALGADPTVLTPLYLRRPDADESFASKSVLT